MFRLLALVLVSAMAAAPTLAIAGPLDLPDLTFPDQGTAPATDDCSQPLGADAACPGQD